MTRKKKIISSILIVLIVLWGAMTWTTGKVLESYYPDGIVKANEELNKLNQTSPFNAQIKTLSYERGFFSSVIHDEIIVTDKKSKVTQTYPIVITVDHGPLPVSRLTSFNILPAAATANIHLSKNKDTEAFYNVAAGNEPLNIDVTAYYTLSALVQLETAKLVIKSQNIGQITAEPIFLNANVNSDGLKNLELSTKQLSIKNSDNPDLTIDNLVYQMEGEKSDKWKNLFWSKQHIVIDKLHSQGSVNNSQTLSGIDFKLDTAKEGENYAKLALDLNAKEYQVDQSNLGELDIKSTLKHLNATALNDYIEAANPPNINQEQVQQAVIAILNDQPIIEIKPLAIKNSEGQSEFNLTLQLAKNGINNFNPRKVTNVLQQFDLNTNFNRDMLSAFLTQINIIAGDTPEQAARNAQQMMKNINQAVKGGAAILDGNNLISKIKLEDDHFDVNGKIYSKNDVNRIIMLLIFFSGL